MRMECFSFDFKRNFAFGRVCDIRINVRNRHNSSGQKVCLRKQLLIGIILRIHQADRRLQNADIGKQLCRNLADIEQQAKITDAVGFDFMVNQFCVFDFTFFQNDRLDLPTNIASFQQRNLRQILRAVGFFLKRFQRSCLFHNFSDFFCSQRLLVSLQAICQLLILFIGQPSFGYEQQHASVRIVQQMLFNQLFKISGLHLFSQASVGIARFDMNKRPGFIVKPAVHYLQPIHQSCRENTIIRFPILKFVIIQAGLQTLLIQSLCNKLFQCLVDDP